MLTHDFIKEKNENCTQDEELLLCYQSILSLVNYTITCTHDIQSVHEHGSLLKTITIFQFFYTVNFKYKVNIKIF